MINKKLSNIKEYTYPLMSILLALLLGAIIIAFIGYSPISAYKDLIHGAFGGKYQLSETLVTAIPVIFTGLSYATARLCGLINLGAEGQFYMGALFGTLVGTNFAGLPPTLHLPLTIIAGFVGGALYGLLAGMLKQWFNASEIITTIMFNNIAAKFVSYCVSGPMMDPAGSMPHSRRILPSATLPRFISGIRIHAGLVIVVLTVFCYYFIMQRTTTGYRMRLIGKNETAGEYAGMNIANPKEISQ